ncbi:MAG: AMP-binding protein [Polyangiaceae bacterium]
MYRLTLGSLEEHGANPALISQTGTLPYTDLAARAGVVTRTLRRFGVLPGSAVALLSAGRSLDEPVGLAGLLGNGNIVVPLDASAPAARLADIARSRGCKALVHDEAAAALAAQIESAMDEGALAIRLTLDEQGTLSTPAAPSSPSREITLRDLSTACILHTSGSTGTPKPVPITWKGLDAFTELLVNEISLTSADRILRVAELVFDLAWFDHIAAFRTGASLLCMSRKELASGRALKDAIVRLQPTVIYGVPSLFMKLTAAMSPGETLPASLRVVMFAGEVFPPKELKSFAERAPGAALYNLYGPTETNVCMYHRVDRAQLDGVSETPIGKPCPYATCWLSADDGSILEGPGTGELYVSGPTTLGGGPYPTRDRVERSEDGLYRFRGRIDRMVKIRGYRVEPGEVEAALSLHPGVEQAAVLSVEDPRLGKVLHAHVATKKGAAEAATERGLRVFLSERLPPYMVPEKVMLLDELPRTTTGKIDYQALAAKR